MNLLVTICGRAGSKGVKSKNLRDFLDYPICWYTLSALSLFLKRQGGNYVNITLAINTDAPELLRQAEQTGMAFLPVKRRDDLAGDRASKVDVIRDTLAAAERETGLRYDVVVDMDLTSPLRRVEDIGNVIAALFEKPDADVALSVTEARRNPYFNQLALDSEGFLHTAIESDFVARQQAPEVFDANASLYAYRPSYLRDNPTILIKSKLVPSRMPDTAVLDIDSERDFELMELLAGYFYRTDAAFGEVRAHIDTLIQNTL